MAFEFDLSGLDSFADDLKSFDFMSHVLEAAKQIQGTLRAKKGKGMMTLRSVMELDDSLALGGGAPMPPPTRAKAKEREFDARSAIADAKPAFVEGDRVWAKYEEDGLYYEAGIAAVISALSYRVVFAGYGNEQETSAENLRPFVPVEELQPTAAAAAEAEEAVVAQSEGGVTMAEIEAEVAAMQSCVAETEPSIALQVAETGTAGEEATPIPPFEEPKSVAPVAAPMPVKGVNKNVRDTIRQRNEEKRKQSVALLAEQQKKSDEEKERWRKMEEARQKELENIDKMFEDEAMQRDIAAAKERQEAVDRKRAAAAGVSAVRSSPAPSPLLGRKQDTPFPSVARKQDSPSPVDGAAPPPAVHVFDASDAASQLTRFKSDKAQVEEMMTAIGKELRELAQKKVLRAQMRQEVIEESVNAVSYQRQAIRTELRGVTLLCKKTALSCGRLPQFFASNVRDMTSAAKTSLTMIAILMQQTQFKSLASKLHVQASNLQKEVGRLIMHFKAQHVELAAAGATEGADLAVLATFAAIVSDILSATNEVVAATEHSAALLKSKPDEQDTIDNAKAEALHSKLAKAKLALQLLADRIAECEAKLIVKQPLSRGSAARANPSRRA